MSDRRHEHAEFCDGMDQKVGPKQDSTVIFVYQEQNKLLDVYEKLVGRETEYVEWNVFQKLIGQCVVHFWVWGHMQSCSPGP